MVGVNGAVSSTLIAGTRLMARDMTARYGMLTEAGNPAPGEQITDYLEFPKLENIVFGGWDLAFKNTYEAAKHHRVLPPALLEQAKAELEAITPWPAVFSGAYAENCKGENVVTAKDFRGELEHIEKCLADFKKKHGLDRVVMVNLASTERWMEITDTHKSLEAFEKGLDASDPAISPAMRYFYVANKLGIPYCNFAPSLTNIPALQQQAEKLGNPLRGHGRKDRADPAQDGARRDVQGPQHQGRGLVLGQLPRQQRRPHPGLAEQQQDQGPQQGGRARLDRRLPRGEPPGPHPLLQAARRREGGVGQHRPHRLLRRPHADEDQLPLPGLGARGSPSSSTSSGCSTSPSARARRASSGSSRSTSRAPTRRRASSPSTTCSTRRRC
ncbi:MAG: inositol-3-phosphate synthase [Sandaracinaceae bacterium]|nr:inositol-3-phosphate synthase [Sandaracinaceae bacterium]